MLFERTTCSISSLLCSCMPDTPSNIYPASSLSLHFLWSWLFCSNPTTTSTKEERWKNVFRVYPPYLGTWHLCTTPTPKIQKKRETIMCPHCGLSLNRRKVRLHILRRHTPVKTDITAQNNLNSQCVDYRSGVCGSQIIFSTQHSNPHHQENAELRTKNNICRINRKCAERSNIRSYECHHLQSLSYCPPAERDIPLLTEQVLQTMVDDRWFGEDKKERCLARQKEAVDAGAPLSCLVTICGPSHKKYISVFEPTILYYSRIDRVMVMYDAKTIS